jgi:hypothetical protein
MSYNRLGRKCNIQHLAPRVEELAGVKEHGDDESWGVGWLGVAAFLRRLLWMLRVQDAFHIKGAVSLTGPSCHSIRPSFA